MSKIDLKDNSEALISALNQTKSKAGQVVGLHWQSVVSPPVDTGNLAGSMTYQVDKDKVLVGTNVHYAKYVEAKQPFLEPSILDNQEDYQNIVANVLKEVVGAKFNIK